MIEHIDITGTGSYAPDESTKKYVRKKIGALDRLTPRHARKTVTAEVKLSEINKAHGNKYHASVVLKLPSKNIVAEVSTLNVLAATDIVEAKLAAQLKKYKEDRVPHVGHRKLLSRFKRSYAREQ